MDTLFGPVWACAIENNFEIDKSILALRQESETCLGFLEQ